MTRYFGKERRPSTIIRDNEVHEAYEEVCRDIGDMARLLPKEYLEFNKWGGVKISPPPFD